jgi:hypothetical protein
MAEGKRRMEPERRAPRQPPSERMPPAGPHAKPELTDKDKTPRSGMLPEADQKEIEAPSG